jgi:protein-S-isoprenylcysteine O-methyltransferase Ste14
LRADAWRAPAEGNDMQALIAQSHWHLYVLDAAIFACFAPEWVGTFYQRPEKGAVSRDRGSHVVLLVATTVAILVAFWCAFGLPQTTIAGRQPLLFWLGIAMMSCGLAFRWYSIRVLGKFFTRDVATRPGQTVVEEGPYRLIRHPSYSGAFLMFLGLGLAMTDWASLLAIALGIAVGYGYRVRVEERALCTDLGDAYRDYMKRTHAFVPYLW